MDWLQALIMGIFQGLTEYLPVSSSGHLAIAGQLIGISDPEQILPFTIVVHVATVLSTLVILWREIVWIFIGTFSRNNKHNNPYGLRILNDDQNYLLCIIVSMIPVGIVGLSPLKDKLENVFSSLLVVGICLLVTAALLSYSYFARPREKEHIGLLDAFIIGIAQAVAVLPGLSRSGSTIGTGLILGNKKEKMAQFSFLMVIPPILGQALLTVRDIMDVGVGKAMEGITTPALIIGFLAAFVTGCIACKWMINLVKRGKMIWFAVYCAVVGTAVIIWQLV